MASAGIALIVIGGVAIAVGAFGLMRSMVDFFMNVSQPAAYYQALDGVK